MNISVARRYENSTSDILRLQSTDYSDFVLPDFVCLVKTRRVQEDARSEKETAAVVKTKTMYAATGAKLFSRRATEATAVIACGR